MQIEPHNKRDGYKVWLDPDEQDQLIDHYAGEDGIRELAVRLMLHGLRSEEVTRVTKEDVRELNGEQEAYKLSLYGKDTTGELEDGKWRETPISRDTKRLIYTLASMGGRKDTVLVDVDRRTVQRWVANAGEALAEKTGNEDWNKLTAHDCRRSWATTTYYQLSGSKDVAQSVIMRWGGWSDAATFESNYLGREPDSLAIKLMDDAGLR